MMEGDEENSIDSYAIDLLRRAKERSQMISAKLKQPETQGEQTFDKIMDKLEKKNSALSGSSSENSLQLSSSPTKLAKRSILRPVTSNSEGEDSGVIPEQRSVKKTVTTFDAITGDTIVEAKTFMSDNEDEYSDEQDSMHAGNPTDGDMNDLPRDTEIDQERDLTEPTTEVDTPKAETTPQLSRTLKKLAEFHSKEDVDSPVHPHTPLETFCEDQEEPPRERASVSRHARSSRFSALAKTINEWEDDTTHHSVPGSRFSEVSSANNRASLAGQPRYSFASSPSASSPMSFGMKQGQITGVRLFHNDNSFNLNSPNAFRGNGARLSVNTSCGRKIEKSQQLDGCRRNVASVVGDGATLINAVNSSSSGNNCSKLGFKQTVLTKLQEKLSRDHSSTNDNDNENSQAESWDDALMKSLELQGFSRRQASPSKQIREKIPTQKKTVSDDDVEDMQIDGEDELPKSYSPKKTYFGGSPSHASPSKITVSSPTRSQSPVKSPLKTSHLSPTKINSPVVGGSPLRFHVDQSPTRRSVSPVKSPVKQQGFLPSPSKSGGKVSSSESTPTSKPVSAIRMKFEGVSQLNSAAPPKPERAYVKTNALKGVVTQWANGKPSAKSPTRNSQFSESRSNTPDPSTLSVAERKRLFEKSNFYLAASKKPAIVEVQPKKPTVFTSSPRFEGVKPQDIDISVVTSSELATKVKRPAPLPPSTEANAPSSPSKRPAPQPPIMRTPGCPPPPPPLPSMPNTSTPTSACSKRRSTSPVRPVTAETRSVKRIKVNAPKPGRIYPSLTDIETETETEVEGHCSEVESMDDSLESQQSLGAEIENIAKACSPIRPAIGSRLPTRYRPSEDFSATFACATVDALIDEALEGQDVTTGTIDCSTILEEDKTSTPNSDLKHSDSDTNGTPSEHTVINIAAADVSSSRSPSPEIQEGDQGEASYSEADTTASSSFAASPVANHVSNPYAIAKKNVVNDPVETQPVQLPEKQKQEESSAITSTKEEETFVPRPLVHTVSFYRRQQQQQKKSEISCGLNEISEQPETNDDSTDEDFVQKPNIGELIKKLENEVERCNLSIAQASKALNWCKALVGFSDSTEYIECERILLIETQKRLALLNSIHRWKTEGALSQQLPTVFSPGKQEVTPSCKGNMKISEISITLRRDFFSAHRAENQYHFICLVKNKHQIEHTSLLTYESQKQGSTLRFTNEFVLQNLDPDFQINLEVYYLESAKEFLPHEAKYRINAKKDSKHATLLLSPMLTPSKKGGKGDHLKTHVQSPAGPDTVKSSSFKFCGGLNIDISSLQRTYWELDKASGPLTGGVSIKVQCSAMGGVEHKGFLTLFEDVSGYGSWVRRWCRLGPAVLEFWKYPEDETECRKPPLGTLNLHECVTSKVRPAPRDVCARANTLLLVTTRAPHPNDKNTLVTSCNKGYTAVRHLISADTREERDVWCHWLNKALANLRAWDPIAKQSVDDNLF